MGIWAKILASVYLSIFLSILLWPDLGWADKEKDFTEYQEQVVQPFYRSGTFERLRLRDGASLSFSVFQNTNPEKAIVILQGRTESMFKFAEWIYDLHQAGFTVFAFDFRGQGHSDRMIPSHPHYGHIDSFDTYVEDLREFLEKVVTPRHQGKLFLYAHSMGGAVATLHELKYPGRFLGSVLQSPMLDIKTDPFPQFIAKFIVRVMIFLGLSENLPPLQKDQKEADPKEANTVTTSASRREYSLIQRVREPTAFIGPPTSRWVYQAFAATAKIKEEGQKLSNSILMFQAGNDLFVNNQGLDLVCQMAKNCKSILFSSAMHELYLERDEVRQELLAKTVAYYNGL
jgi:lysophospholipase